jgi:hypothetical protein
MIGDKMDIKIAEARSAQLGTEHGSALGSWVIDANTSKDQCLNVIRGYEDGDPATLDLCPMPLSGEWADSLTPESLCRALGFVDEADDLEWQCDHGDTLCTAYEESFSIAWWDTVIQAAYLHSNEFEPCGVCGLYGHRAKEHDD